MLGLKDLELTSWAYLKCTLCKIHIKSVMNSLSLWVAWRVEKCYKQSNTG